jgi:hypothetical protein
MSNEPESSAHPVIVQTCRAGVGSLPRALYARTSNECRADGRPLSVTGEEHACQPASMWRVPRSNRHWKPVGDRVPTNWNVAELRELEVGVGVWVAPGDSVMVVSGMSRPSE